MEELPFAGLGLVGRSSEKKILQRVIDENIPVKQESPSSTQWKDPQHTMALISGHSGTGKSVLAMHFQQQCFERHAFFVSGKFDLQQMEEPYSGIKAALADLCEQMLALDRSDDSSYSKQSKHSTNAHANNDDLVEDPRSLPTLQSLLTSGLSASEIEALSKVIPDVLKVVSLPNESNKAFSSSTSASASASASIRVAEKHFDANGDAKTDAIGYQEQSGRLKYILRSFLQIVCKFCPVIMVVDDLQWGDEASMDLLRSWMFMDAGSRHTDHSLLIVGCFRSDASEHSPILHAAIEELKNVQEARSINIVEIDLDDMDVAQVHELVCGLLLPINDITESGGSIPTVMGNHESLALARIVHKRTGGNIFYVKQFLQQLFRDGLVYYDLTVQQWAWKTEAEIVDNSAATTNIVNMMRDKIHDVKAAHQILPIAACLGATFSSSTLELVIRSLSIHSDHAPFFKKTFDMPRALDDTWIAIVLRSCEREGLIESCHVGGVRMSANKVLKKKKKKKSDMYSFVHDKIQEASFSLIPTDSVAELQYRVGEALTSCLTPQDLKANIFMVASLLNARHDLIPYTNHGVHRMKIATMNTMAGNKAVSCGAFQSALSYFKTAISLLPVDHWESQFQASLNLYSSVAECSFVTSDMEQVHFYADQVTNQKCPILNKIRAYHILIDAVFAEAESNRGLNPVGLCLFVLSELGYKFPQNKVTQTAATLHGMVKTKLCVPKWTLKQFDDLPVCSDAKELAITKTLSKLSVAAYVFKPDIVPLAIVKLAQRTLEHGISQHSAPSFTMLGIIVGYFMGDFHSARMLAHIALRLVDRVGYQETKAQTMYIAYLMCLHWTSPIEDGKAPLLESYRVGMANGEIESAAWGIYNYMLSQLLTGTPLETINEEMSVYAKVVKDFHQINQYHICAISWQMIHNLLGKSGNRVLLVGDVYDETAEMQSLEVQPNPMRYLYIKTTRLYAAVHFGDFAIGAKIAAESSDQHLKGHAALIALPPCIFDSGMCCYAACADDSISKKLRKKYLKTARKCRAKLRGWQKKGNMNCDHYVAILDAEHCALKRRFDPTFEKYAVAIALTANRGYTQYEALVHERMADRLLKKDSTGSSKAKEHMSKAIGLTEKWGAIAKIKILHQKYDAFLVSPEMST